MKEREMEQKTFSIVVILYNSEAFVDKCVNSILNQTRGDFELLLVDDGSKDKTLEKCRSYEKMDSRVKAIPKENGGISDARNTGIHHATGEYIVFVDGDDWLGEKYLESMYELIQLYSDVDCVLGRMTEYTVETKRERVVGSEFNEEINDLLKKIDNGKDACTTMLKKYGKFPMGMGARGVYRLKMIKDNNIFFWGKYYEDIEFTMNVMCHSRKVLCNTNPYYYFRNHATSTSKKSQIKYAIDIVDMLQQWCKLIEEEEDAEFKKALSCETGRRYANMVAKYARRLPDEEINELIVLIRDTKNLLKLGRNWVCKVIRISFGILGVPNSIRLCRRVFSRK